MTNSNLLTHQTYALSDLCGVGLTPTQARRLLDALAALSTLHLQRTGGGERRVSPELFAAIKKVYGELRPSRVSTEFVTAILRAVTTTPATTSGQTDWDTALNLAMYVGDTRTRLLGLWELLESTGRINGVKLPEWSSAFYAEHTNNAR